ncbi:cache domain-containing sensor histidine kinase [Cohnella soli]|uniref:Sensor histidine kinase n=1 Tax=Cohnella soli TaxID=425005 RepID=A0ABW0I2G5_9BACL
MFRRSLTTKMIAIYFLILLLPIVLISLVSYSIYRNAMEKQLFSLSNQIVGQAKSNLDIYLQELTRLTITPYSSPEMMNFLEGRSDGSTEWAFKQKDLIQGILFSYLNANKDIAGFFLYADNGNLFQQSNSTGLLNPYPHYSQAPWYKAAVKADYSNIILGTHREEQLKTRPYVLSAVRIIYSMTTFKPTGAIVVDMDASVLKRITAPLTFGKRSRILIADQNDQIIYDTGNGDTLETRLDTDSLHRDGWLTFQSKLSAAQWTIVGAVPATEMLKPVRTIGLWIVVLFGICLLFGGVMAAGATFRVTKPIRTLRGLMHEMEKENFNAKYTGQQIDEIGELGRGFNRMSSRIHELIQDVYRAEIMSKEAQIVALKTEINPHFLFNVLESVRMRAESGDNRSISVMIQSLGKLLRASLGGSHAKVLLSEELDRLMDYYTIIRLNYRERIQLVNEVPPEDLNLKVPSFILQPILENAVKHGLEKQAGTVSVWLRTKREEPDTLVIEMINDGPSIPSDKKARLQFYLERTDGSPGDGIGLLNVHRRIRLLYGSAYGIVLPDVDTRGVHIQIRLPGGQA